MSLNSKSIVNLNVAITWQVEVANYLIKQKNLIEISVLRSGIVASLEEFYSCIFMLYIGTLQSFMFKIFYARILKGFPTNLLLRTQKKSPSHLIMFLLACCK